MGWSGFYVMVASVVRGWFCIYFSCRLVVDVLLFCVLFLFVSVIGSVLHCVWFLSVCVVCPSFLFVALRVFDYVPFFVFHFPLRVRHFCLVV